MKIVFVKNALKPLRVLIEKRMKWMNKVNALRSVFMIGVVLLTTWGCGPAATTGGPPGFDDPEIPLTSDSILEAEVMLEDKLSDILLPDHCGARITEMSLNYKILRLVRGKYEGSRILIHHICIREAVEEKWIRNEVKYTYKLKRRKMGLFNNKYVPVNDFEIIP